MKTIAGCATRVLVNVTAPEGVETELTGYVRVEGESRSAEVQADGGVVFPPLPAGEFLYEIRVNGKAIAWGHLLARMSAFPPTGGEMVDWELAADLTVEDAAVITLEMLPGARGLTGESAYDAAVQGGYEGTEEEFAAMLAGLPQDAANAAESAQDAAASQAAAADSESAAAASATAAGNSATAASASAATASTKAADAAGSAASASTKATDAANSATAAAGSATEAGISAASAGASAQDAADDAADAATAAGTATAQAALATTQAGNAAASATTASQQATAAGNSATAAAGSATTASTKAAEAADSASTADSKAADAAQSAQDAADAAEDAAESAELLGNAALQGSNNTFTQTNTFNGAVALNGTVTLPETTQLAMGPDEYTVLELLQLMDIMKIVQLSGSFEAIDFKKAFPGGWYEMTRSLNINLPKGKTVVSSLELTPYTGSHLAVGVFSLSLTMGELVSSGPPLKMNGNGNFKNLRLSFPKATSLIFGPGDPCCSDTLYFNAPLITSLPVLCDATYSANKCPLNVTGNIDKVRDLHSHWDTYWTRTRHWSMSAKGLANFKIHGIKLDLESVQFIAGNLKDWSGDTATHEANIGVSAAIRDTEAVALAAAKAELEAKGWSVTFTYN